MVISQKPGQIFWKFIQFSSKQRYSPRTLLIWLHGRGLHPLQPPVPLPAARKAQRVNNEPGKILNLLFFVYFFWKWAETFNKLQFSTSGKMQCFYLAHAAVEYFEKLTFQKNKKAIFKRSYLQN